MFLNLPSSLLHIQIWLNLRFNCDRVRNETNLEAFLYSKWWRHTWMKNSVHKKLITNCIWTFERSGYKKFGRMTCINLPQTVFLKTWTVDRRRLRHEITRLRFSVRWNSWTSYAGRTPTDIPLKKKKTVECSQSRRLRQRIDNYSREHQKRLLRPEVVDDWEFF